MKHSLPQWGRVSTVLLDMDGTLLDLRFDNYFWLELVPREFAALHGKDLEAARGELERKFAAKQGMLQWYCTDYWSHALGLDIASLKYAAREHICFLPGAQHFLNRVRNSGRRVLLVTNAHHDSVRVKSEHTRIHELVDVVVSSHSFGVPKEHPDFWTRLASQHAIDSQQALFVDDSLAVLRAAHAHGIAQTFAISKPDSTLPARVIEEFPAVDAVHDLLWDEAELSR